MNFSLSIRVLEATESSVDSLYIMYSFYNKNSN